jgi:hypothetical protein
MIADRMSGEGRSSSEDLLAFDYYLFLFYFKSEAKFDFRVIGNFTCRDESESVLDLEGRTRRRCVNHGYPHRRQSDEAERTSEFKSPPPLGGMR